MSSVPSIRVKGQRAVHAAIEHGINFFDVAPYYGRTLAEERLGAALKGKRNKVILATKSAAMMSTRSIFPPNEFARASRNHCEDCGQTTSIY